MKKNVVIIQLALFSSNVIKTFQSSYIIIHGYSVWSCEILQKKNLGPTGETVFSRRLLKTVKPAKIRSIG